MGVQFVVAILLFLFVGKWLDSRLGTSPWLLILGVFSGATASMVAMYRRVFPPDKTKQADSSKKQP
jgi:F0F1-type ATP synthase assembly protein I